MKSLKENFLLEVLQHIKSKEAKEFVQKELNYHLVRSKSDFVSKGMAEEEAEERAVKQMGSPTELGRQFNKLHRPRIDWILWGLFILAFSMGLLPVLSSQGDYAGNIVLKQVVYIVCGTVVAFLMMLLDYRKLERFGWLFLSVGLLILVSLILVPNTMINGVPYIRMIGFTISNMTSLPFLLLFWAAYLSKEKPKLWIIVGIFFLTVFLFLALSGLVEVMIYSVIVVTLFWRSAVKRRTVYLTIAIAFVLSMSPILLFWFLSAEYQKVRVLAFLHPDDYAQEAGYMYLKVRELMSGGGWFGHSTFPKFIPDLMTDLAFVNVTYYYGWVMAGLLVLVLTLLLVRMIFVLVQIPVQDRFGKQLITGVISLFTIQFLYNIGMVLGLLPIVSLSLPFISYGMTPALLNSFIIGVTLSVYRRKQGVSPPLS